MLKSLLSLALLVSATERVDFAGVIRVNAPFAEVVASKREELVSRSEQAIRERDVVRAIAVSSVLDVLVRLVVPVIMVSL